MQSIRTAYSVSVPTYTKAFCRVFSTAFLPVPTYPLRGRTRRAADGRCPLATLNARFFGVALQLARIHSGTYGGGDAKPKPLRILHPASVSSITYLVSSSSRRQVPFHFPSRPPCAPRGEGEMNNIVRAVYAKATRKRMDSTRHTDGIMSFFDS